MIFRFAKDGDFERNDDIYDQLETWAPREDIKKQRLKLDVPDDADRKDRTQQEMADEAAMYRAVLSESSKL